MAKYYVGDIGTEIVVDCGTTITGASDTLLKVRKPDGTVVEWAATIEGTTSLKYTTITGDFDQNGIYCLHASLTIGGWSGLGEAATFKIHNMCD